MVLPPPVQEEPVALAVPPKLRSPVIDGGVLFVGVVTPAICPLAESVVALVRLAM